MRTVKLAVAALAVCSVAACQRNDSKVNDDLAKDLALASSKDGITLAPTAAGRPQQVVSAVEQIRPGSSRMANSSRAAVYHAAPKSATRAPVAVAESPAVTEAAAPAAVEAQQPTPAAAPAATTPAPDPTPVATAPNPQAQPYPSGVTPEPAPSDGPSIGDVIGAVIRGGVVDGDNCDPRPRRHGGMPGGVIISGGDGGGMSAGAGRAPRGVLYMTATNRTSGNAGVPGTF